MGLDSVELLMEFEKYFGISIPDQEAEKIYTIQLMVDTVSRHLNIFNNSTELRDQIFLRVNEALLKSGLIHMNVALPEYISIYLSPHNKETWELFQNELGIDVPKPDILNKDSNRFLDKIKASINWAPMYDWSTVSIEQFIAAICANNYEELIDMKSIKSTYEIYIAVTAITVEKIGVDYYEITTEKTFSSDLGVD